ncbi:MAG TPA: carboxypeptidase-like regulatory domain-containing protein, partial [Acidobacteriaceae bacterium]|nr:carboxypeptidase-like regulatory domain-containing protein [Acidobacteriaceae bacterium]
MRDATNPTRQYALNRVLTRGIQAFLLFAFLLGMTPFATAQYRASIQGVVTDPSGAVVPGVTLTLKNNSNNHTMTATSNDSGVYNFNALPPDTFTLTATRQGFQTKTIESLHIIPEQANAVNIKLALGTVSENVTVSGSEVPALDTETATVSSTITSNQIEHLPSFGRDVFTLAQLTPGVFGNGARSANGGSSNNPGNQGPGGSSSGIFQTENGPQIQTRGGRYNTNGISMDGISTVSAVWGGTSIITPSESSVANMKVVSNSYDAENGRFSGSSIEVTTKSGSNQFHGGAFFRVARPGLNAYQRWNGLASNQPGTPAQRNLKRDTDRFNQFGADLGGPLWKNRLFFFFNFESQPMNSTATPSGWYETPEFDSSAAASGSIAAQYLGYPGVAPVGTLINQTCTQAGLKEGVNCQTIDGKLDVGSPLTSGLGHQDLTYGGSSTTPGVGNGLDGVPDLQFLTTPNPTSTSQVQYNGRVDAQVTQNDRISFALYWVPISTTHFNGPTRQANLWNHTQVNNAFSAIWLHTFSPTLINEARANAAGWRWNEVDSNPQAPFGFPTDNIGNAGSASINYFGAPGPSNLNQWTYTYRDVLTKNVGRHNLKVGGELSRLYYLNNVVYASRPSFSFWNIWDFANDAPHSESGNFDHATGVPFAGRQDDRINIWGFFVQDNFKVRPNLTLNLGLRWSYFGAYYSKENNLNVLELGSGANALTDLRFRAGGSLDTPQKNNWGPQFGFAW